MIRSLKTEQTTIYVSKNGITVYVLLAKSSSTDDVKQTFLESLILAQDERWRRA